MPERLGIIIIFYAFVLIVSFACIFGDDMEDEIFGGKNGTYVWTIFINLILLPITIIYWFVQFLKIKIK